MYRRPPRSPLFPSPTLSRPRSNPAKTEGEATETAAETNGGKSKEPTVYHVFSQEEDGLKQIADRATGKTPEGVVSRSEEHTSELQSRQYLVCRLLLEKKKDN